MRLLVSKDLLRQMLGLEAPIVEIRPTEDQDTVEFIVGSSDGPQELLRGTGFSHFCDDGQFYRMEYEVI